MFTARYGLGMYIQLICNLVIEWLIPVPPGDHAAPMLAPKAAAKCSHSDGGTVPGGTVPDLRFICYPVFF